jgi:hypothetical protein
MARPTAGPWSRAKKARCAFVRLRGWWRFLSIPRTATSSPWMPRLDSSRLMRLAGESATETRVRVNAQLIDAESGAHLWAERFEEDVADLFKLQDQVVGRLANSLGSELVGGSGARCSLATSKVRAVFPNFVEKKSGRERRVARLRSFMSRKTEDGETHRHHHPSRRLGHCRLEIKC